MQLATAHTPFMHAAAALGSEQRMSQPPQWEVLASGSTHAPEQHD